MVRIAASIAVLALPALSAQGASRAHGRCSPSPALRIQARAAPRVALRGTFGATTPGGAGLDAYFQFELCTPPPVAYCTPGTGASGCQATLSASGTPSATAASGFIVTAGTVEGQKDGMFFYGSNGQQADSWGNG